MYRPKLGPPLLHVRLSCTSCWFSQTELAAHQAKRNAFEFDYYAGGSGGTSVGQWSQKQCSYVQLVPETPIKIAHNMLLTFALCVHEYPCPCSCLIYIFFSFGVLSFFSFLSKFDALSRNIKSSLRSMMLLFQEPAVWHNRRQRKLEIKARKRRQQEEDFCERIYHLNPSQSFDNDAGTERSDEHSIPYIRRVCG